MAGRVLIKSENWETGRPPPRSNTKRLVTHAHSCTFPSPSPSPFTAGMSDLETRDTHQQWIQRVQEAYGAVHILLSSAQDALNTLHNVINTEPPDAASSLLNHDKDQPLQQRWNLYQTAQQEDSVLRQVLENRCAFYDVLENMTEMNRECYFKIRKASRRQSAAMLTPTCEMRRCRVYSHYLHSFPTELCWIIADYANHHSDITKTIKDPVNGAEVFPGCWCQRRCLMMLCQGCLSEGLYESSKQAHDILKQYVKDSQTLNKLQNTLKELDDWHQDLKWPGIMTILSPSE